ncbi:MAG: AbrB family transcriptional regulator [Nitrososphaerota archaeon]|nr:AbrB family transcriptional regulator [Nitrososphaerota archaeon]
MASQNDVEKTALIKANKTSPSLKTTVPEGVRKKLELNPDTDRLEWSVVRQEGKLIAKVRRIRSVEVE